MAPPRTPSGVRAGAERGSATGKLELERSRNRGSTGFSEGGHGRAPRDRNGTADIEVLISWSILKERRWYECPSWYQAARGSAAGVLKQERSRYRGSTGLAEGGHGRPDRDAMRAIVVVVVVGLVWCALPPWAASLGHTRKRPS